MGAQSKGAQPSCSVSFTVFPFLALALSRLSRDFSPPTSDSLITLRLCSGPEAVDLLLAFAALCHLFCVICHAHSTA